MKYSVYVGYTLIVLLFLAILAGSVYLTTIKSTNVVLLPPPTNPNDCPNVLLRKGNRHLLINTQKPNVDGVNPIYFNGLDDYIAYAKQQNKIRGQTCPLLFLQEDEEDTHDDETRHDDHIRTDNSPPHAAAALPTPVIQVPPLPTRLPNPVPPKPVSFPFPPTVMQPYIPPKLPSEQTSPDQKRVAVQYVDASRDDAPFNQNLYPGFDPMNLYVGVYTTIDQVHDSTRNTDTNTPFSDNAMDPNWGGVQYTRNQVKSGKYDDNIVSVPTYSAPPNTFTIPSFRPLVDPAATQAPLTTLLNNSSAP